ncbi:MAG: O-antigen ligase family protein [Candidatus Omnitrophota bacterium]
MSAHNGVLVERINAVARVFLSLLIFWLPYGSAVVEACVIISLLLWIAKRIILFDARSFKNLVLKGKISLFLKSFRPAASFLDLPILVFLAACLISVVLSAYPLHALRGFTTKTLEWFIVYFLVLEFIATKKHIMTAVGVFLFSAFAVNLDAIVQFHFTQKDIFLGQTIIKGSGATASFNTYNSLGGYLTFVFPVALSLLFVSVKRAWKVIFFVIFVSAIWCLIATLSRGAWLSVCLAGAFFLFFINPKAALLSLTVLFVSAILFPIFASSQVKETFRIAASQQGSVAWRFDVWLYSARMIAQKPIFGYGLNTYMMLFEKCFVNPSGLPLYYPSYAHNCYIQIAFEIGIFGLGSFLWLMLQSFQKTLETIKSYMKKTEKNLAMLNLGLISGVAGFLSHSFFDTNFYSLKLSVLFWYMIGLLISIDKLLRLQNIPAIK